MDVPYSEIPVGHLFIGLNRVLAVPGTARPAICLKEEYGSQLYNRARRTRKGRLELKRGGNIEFFAPETWVVPLPVAMGK